jgi:transcriptional regulator with XRE-family HTH domain
MTPNQLVAWNLSRARARRGWTQEEAARRLEPFLGESWSKAVFSMAERSITGGRIRNFTADDLYAFARAFELPIAFFLAPAFWVEEIAPPNARETTTHDDALDLCFGLNEEAQQILWQDHILDSPAPVATKLVRWAQGYAAAVSELEAYLDTASAIQAELKKSREKKDAA